MKALVTLVFFASSAFAALDFSRYHTQQEIHDYLQNAATQFPALVSFHVLGSSDNNREIAYVIMTKAKDPNVPNLYFNGTHHGDEWSATEGILGLMDYLLQNQNDPAVSKMLSTYAFYLQPIVNPDGHQAQTREDSNGVDPNRDYAYPGRTEKDSFGTKNIQLVKSLTDKVNFKAAVAYHSGIEEVLWSWCYTSDHVPTNYDLLYTLAKNSAQAMGMNRYLQSFEDYETEGEFIDYLYMKQGTLALTFEVSEIKTPPESQLAYIVERSVKGAINVVNGLQNYANGTLRLEPAPLYTSGAKRSPKWVELGRKLE